jgi:acyl-CoA thioesterase YciA
MRVPMMPKDANPNPPLPNDTTGHLYLTIFGGVILSHIDAAGAIGAIHEIKKLGGKVPGIVTVAMNKVEFHHPVFVGDVVSFFTEVVRIGKTSIAMQVSVRVERGGVELTVTAAEVIYVTVEVGAKEYRPVAVLAGKE